MTPDPPRRPVPPGRRSPLPPIGDYLGMRLEQLDNASATVVMPGSEWFCRLYREVSPGIIGALGDVVGSAAIAGSVDPHLRWVVINVTHSFMAPVVADGRPLVSGGSPWNVALDVAGEVSGVEGIYATEDTVRAICWGLVSGFATVSTEQIRAKQSG